MKNIFLTIAAFLLISGCYSTGTTVRFEQRSVVGITSATIGEYTIPVISVSEGPSITAYQNKDVCSMVEIRGTATVTNDISILGMYYKKEEKNFDFAGTFTVAPTNSPSVK